MIFHDGRRITRLFRFLLALELFLVSFFQFLLQLVFRINLNVIHVLYITCLLLRDHSHADLRSVRPLPEGSRPVLEHQPRHCLPFRSRLGIPAFLYCHFHGDRGGFQYLVTAFLRGISYTFPIVDLDIQCLCHGLFPSVPPFIVGIRHVLDLS